MTLQEQQASSHAQDELSTSEERGRKPKVIKASYVLILYISLCTMAQEGKARSSDLARVSELAGGRPLS